MNKHVVIDRICQDLDAPEFPFLLRTAQRKRYWMSLEKLKIVAEQVLGRAGSVRGRGEEATKQALILPVIDALGFDVWNPTEVCSE